MNISKFKCTDLILSQRQQHIRAFSSSFNFKNFSKYRDQRKQFEQDFQRQKEQQQYEKERKRYDRTSQQQEYQFKEQHQQQEEIHFQGQSHTPIKIPIFKIFFKLLSQIIVSVIKRKLFSTTTEYKELYEFTTNVLNENKAVIQSVIQSPIPIATGKPKILNTSFIPKHSQFSNQDDQIMMVLELDTPPQSISQQSSISLNVVTLAKSLPDRLVQSSFPWNLFGNDTTVQKVADPIRVTLLVDIEQIDPFGFIVSEKKEIPLFNAVDEQQSPNPFSDFSQEYDIFENHQQKNHYDKQEQHRRSNKNQSTNKHDTIELDQKDYHEVYNNNNNKKK